VALNPTQFLLYPLAVVCCFIGRRVVGRWPKAWLVAIVFLMLALPALCYDLYYLHPWNEPIWLYRIRSWPASELLAAPAGLIAGWIQGRLQGRWRVSMYSVSALVLLAMAVPYVKQLFGPGDLEETWKDGVCLQSSPSTCGPASAATLLASMGIPASEANVARDAFSTLSGTENWYLKRAIERRGVHCRYEWIDSPVQDLPYPSIAGIKLGKDSGHFIAVLGKDADGYLIADPIYGRSKITRQALAKGRRAFSGFFLVLSKP
jgi:hypothetical protein